MKLAEVDLSIKPEVDEMSALWAAEGSGSQPDPDDKSDETKVDETAPADDKPADDKPADDKPADDKPADDKPADTEPVEVDFTPPAWISLLPQEAQAQAVKDFRNSRSNVKAQSTRVSELTKHLMATRQELEKAKKLSTVLPRIDLTSDKALEELAKEFPEAATALKSVAEKLTQQVTAHNASISNQLVQAQESQANAIASEIAQLTEADKAEQRRVVEQYVPDAPQIVRDPAFANWLSGQSPAVQAMINSPHAGDNITLFNLYKGSVRKPEPAAAKLAEFAELPSKGGKPKAAELRDDPNADPTDYWKTYIDNSKGR